MIRFFLILFLFAYTISGFAQDSKIASIVRQKEIKTEYYEMTEAGSKVLYLPMEFGKSDFTYDQQEAIKRLENSIIARIDLVYSDYPGNQDFSPLTKKRFESLQKLLPKVFNNSSIQFRKVSQTIGTQSSTA